MFFFIYILPAAVFSTTDNRLTINRLGYGVMFDKVGQIADSGGVVFYTTTWVVLIPKFKVPELHNVTCNSHITEINNLCQHVNDIVAQTKTEILFQLNEAEN